MMTENQDFLNNLESSFQEFSSSFHHAFLLETKNRELVFQFFEDKIKIESVNKENLNENLFLNLKVFDIEKARDVLEYGKTNFSSKHFIILSFYSINREAQNALLKFLEEANQNIKIILIIHTGANILPTIYSRLYKLSLAETDTQNNEDEFLESIAEKFLKTKNIDRMNLKEIKDILSRKDEYALENEDKERSDREILEKFLLKLHDIVFEKYNLFLINSKIIDKNENEEYLKNIENILASIQYAKNNSSSGKTLLEYLALELPII